jgi:hypothetical protein
VVDVEARIGHELVARLDVEAIGERPERESAHEPIGKSLGALRALRERERTQATCIAIKHARRGGRHARGIEREHALLERAGIGDRWSNRSSAA